MFSTNLARLGMIYSKSYNLGMEIILICNYFQQYIRSRAVVLNFFLKNLMKALPQKERKKKHINKTLHKICIMYFIHIYLLRFDCFVHMWDAQSIIKRQGKQSKKTIEYNKFPWFQIELHGCPAVGSREWATD